MSEPDVELEPSKRLTTGVLQCVPVSVRISRFSRSGYRRLSLVGSEGFCERPVSGTRLFRSVWKKYRQKFCTDMGENIAM
jgi:hypothetical protein